MIVSIFVGKVYKKIVGEFAIMTKPIKNRNDANCICQITKIQQRSYNLKCDYIGKAITIVCQRL